jgi:hypothetical protein
MKTLILSTALSLSLLGMGAYAADNAAAAPDPGTVQSTDTKSDAAQNNTPRVNPNPNPEPASNPPGVDNPHPAQ